LRSSETRKEADRIKKEDRKIMSYRTIFSYGNISKRGGKFFPSVKAGINPPVCVYDGRNEFTRFKEIEFEE
jgi:hypothetical protein